MKCWKLLRKLRCLLSGHRWDGPFLSFGDMPAGIRGCRRCGVWNYDLCASFAEQGIVNEIDD